MTREGRYGRAHLDRRVAGLPAADRAWTRWAGGRAAKSSRSAHLAPRTGTADKVVKSVCPYCAVGCGQNVYVKDGKVVQIEGDPDSPVSRGRLCPKGSASLQLTTGAPAGTGCCTGARTAPSGRTWTWTRRWT